MADVLRVEGVAVHFGGVRAVDGVSLRLRDGEILGLVGPNGSGKSTLLNALTGLVPAHGQAYLDGRPLPLGRPLAIRRLGLLRAFQTAQTFGELSCIENVLLSTPDRRLTGLTGSWGPRWAMWRHERGRWARALDALQRVGLDDLAEQQASLLTYGQQRLLELARCLAGAPRVLLLDEPSAGLNATETGGLAELLEGVRDDGVPIVLVDHKIDFVDRLCDRLVVLQLGAVIAEGEPTAVWSDPAVADAYLGATHHG